MDAERIAPCGDVLTQDLHLCEVSLWWLRGARRPLHEELVLIIRLISPDQVNLPAVHGRRQRFRWSRRIDVGVERQKPINVVGIQLV